MEKLAATALLLMLCAIANAVMDLSSEKAFQYDWWNKNESWSLKYKNEDYRQGPRFFGSTTFLVFLTDGWHFFQFVFHSSWQMVASIWILKDFSSEMLVVSQVEWINSLAQLLIVFFSIKIFFSLIFELFYRQCKP